MFCSCSLRAAATTHRLSFNPFSLQLYSVCISSCIAGHPASVFLHLLSLVVQLIFAGSLLIVVSGSTDTWAQTAAAPVVEQVQTVATHYYDIPAGPLNTVLTRFSTESGIFLVGANDLAQGKHSPGIRGTFSVQKALDVLLTGTGLETQRNAQGQYVLQPAASAVGTLPLMTVTGAAINPGVTEGTGSYTTSQSSYGKGQTLKELPQTVTVMTYESIQDQGLKTLDDVLERTPGVTVQQNTSVDSLFYSRGFQITSFQIDGNSPLLSLSSTQTFAGDLNTSQLDLAMFDSVEVLRGSDALYGTSGEPGGAINLVRKKPTRQFQVKALAHAGSWNNYRSELDVGGSIMENGRIRGRLVGVYENRKFFYDVAKSDKYLFYGIVEADITNSTLLTFGGDLMRQDSTYWRFGLPRYSNGADIGLPRSTSFVTDDDRWKRNNNRQFIRLDQAIGTDWTLGIEASRAQSEVDQSSIFWWGAIDPITFSGFNSAIGHGRQFDRDETQKTLDAVLKGSFHLLSREHKVILGANINQYKSGVKTYRHMNDIGRPNFFVIQIPNFFEFDPEDYRFDDSYFLAFRDRTTITQKGLYGSLAAKIADPLTLIVGGRMSWYSYNNVSNNFSSTTGAVTSTSLTKYQDNVVFTPYLGVVFDLTEQWSTYGSIAETYKPQANNRKGPLPGTPLAPVTGRSYEIGVKGNLFDGRLNTALAFYSIKRNGQAMEDPAYPPTFGGELGSSCCYLDDGRITSKGVDTEVSGEIVPGWQILAGYTFNDNESKAGNPLYGSTVTPRHLFKLWSSYELKGMLSGLKLGGGLTAQSSAYIDGITRTFNAITGLYDGPSVNYKFTEPGHVLVDLFAQYRLNKHWSATLNVNNVFDKKYYQIGTGNMNSRANANNWYGTPRNFLLSMRYSY